LPGLTRQSIRFAKKKMDARIICAKTRFALLSGHDDLWRGNRRHLNSGWRRTSTSLLSHDRLMSEMA